MTPRRRLCDCRECAITGDVTLVLSSTDPQTVLDALRSVAGDESFTAHLYRDDAGWGALVGLREPRGPETFEAGLGEIPRRTGHRLHVTVEEARSHGVVFDRVYHPSGDMSEPIPG